MPLDAPWSGIHSPSSLGNKPEAAFQMESHWWQKRAWLAEGSFVATTGTEYLHILYRRRANWAKFWRMNSTSGWVGKVLNSIYKDMKKWSENPDIVCYRWVMGYKEMLRDLVRGVFEPCRGSYWICLSRGVISIRKCTILCISSGALQSLNNNWPYKLFWFWILIGSMVSYMLYIYYSEFTL